jgi:serine/threonine-protein kinase
VLAEDFQRIITKVAARPGIENYGTMRHDEVGIRNDAFTAQSNKMSMANLTLEEFLKIVQDSQLVGRDRLMRLTSDCQLEATDPQAVKILADHLLSRGVVTEWQQRNLLAGKSKGFFLGGYKLLCHLGTGGMSSVFLAQHPLIDRKLALKVLPASRVNDASFLDRFVREAQSTARLSHSNIVRVYDIEQQGDTHYIVMEYVAGKDLKAMVKSHGRLSLEKAAFYIAQAAAGLQHAHDRGLIHRDVKPANLVVSDDDIVKILDLGLARIEDDDELASLTIDNAENMMGTADYLAPEQARNAHDIDHRADIYSLGCTFYYLLVGHPPFTDGTIAERILKHQFETPRDVRAEREDCPHAVADVCMTMLAKDPHDRPRHAITVAHRLQRWLAQQGFDQVSPYVLEPPVDTPPLPLANRDASSTTATSASHVRKSRTFSAARTPLWLWVLLAVSGVICIGLLVHLLLRES